MIIFLLVLMLIFLINIKFDFKNFNKNYMSADNTRIINGLFVIIVFFSHFMSYANTSNILDTSMIQIISLIGQLMVTTFLFYSGYGIYEKIKINKDKYINDFPKKRLLTTFLNFIFVVLLFLLMQTILGKKYSIQTILLSLIGWDSLGNSNWYMFVIFYLYLIIILCFKIFKNNKNSLCFITLLSIIYIIIINNYKPNCWFDTILCFPAGMWYSYYKEKIDKFIFNNKNYIITNLITFLIFVILYIFKSNIYIYNILSIVFVLIINLFSIKIFSTSKILLWFGKNVFWIYILQRIPMIILFNKINIYLYFIISFIITIGLTIILEKISKNLLKKLIK